MTVKLSALRVGVPLTPRNILGTDFSQRQSRPHARSAARRIKSIEKSNYPIGNQIRDLPACRVVLQPATQPCALSDKEVGN
jgi:hypothetical protein